jgi:hypothetical protein
MPAGSSESDEPASQAPGQDAGDGAETIAVIGTSTDTAAAADWPGHEVLRVPQAKWTLAKNDQWVASVIQRRLKVYVASQLTPANLWNNVAERERVFARELRQLQEAGYSWRGHYLVPPSG